MPNWKRKHGREKGEVKLPALPTASQFRARKTSIYQSVLQASGREGDKVLSWIREVEKPGATPEDLADKTEEFATLDRESRSVSDQACPVRVWVDRSRRGTTRRFTKSAEWQEGVSCCASCSILRNRQDAEVLFRYERPPESHFER